MSSLRVLRMQSTGNNEIILDHTDGGVSSHIGILSFERNGDHLAHIMAQHDGATDSARIAFNTQATGGAFGSGLSSNERMCITSVGRVGIGTTSPSSLLHLESASSPTLQLKDTTNNVTFKAYAQDSNTHLANISNHDLIIDTNNTERMRIVSSGNVGIGKTAPVAKLDVNGQGSGPSVFYYDYAQGCGIRVHGEESAIDLVGSDANNHASSLLLRNANEGFGFINNSSSNTLELKSFNASADDFRIHSTGHNVSNLVTILSIAKAGNVGIGTSSPSEKLDVAGQVRIAENGLSKQHLKLVDSNATSKFGQIGFDNGILRLDSFNTGATGTIQFYRSTTGFGAESARIDSSGNFGIGTTHPDSKLDVTGGDITVNVSGTGLMNYKYNNSVVGSITTNGISTAFNTSSDARLKDITGSARGLEVIKELNPVAYDWKADGKSDEGLIAQEVMELVPNAVSGSEEDMYQMDYSKLVVHLVKGMQEQQKEIEELKKHSHSPKGLENMEGYENLIETIESLKAEIKLLKGGN